MTQPLPTAAALEEDSRVMTLDELDEVVQEVLLVEAWAKAVRDRIQESLEAGYSFKNARLEPKRATRAWNAEEEDVIDMILAALERLGKPSNLDVVAPRKVLSPAQAEKVTGKANFAELLADQVKAESSGWNLKLLG